MKAIGAFARILLYRGVVDFRKWTSGLAAIVEHELGEILLDETLFVFISRNRRAVKMLYWNKTGIALWTTKLDRDQFHFGRTREGKVEISSEQLNWLLAGVDITKITPHREVKIMKYS